MEEPHANDIILKTATSILVFVILAFGVYLFLIGHNAPGGGFVGGLITSSAFTLLYMVYGMKTMEHIIRVNFQVVLAIGLLLAVTTGVGSLFVGAPFLTHTFAEFHFPIFGNVELATAMIFDFGIFLTVIGVTMTIILAIAEDR